MMVFITEPRQRWAPRWVSKLANSLPRSTSNRGRGWRIGDRSFTSYGRRSADSIYFSKCASVGDKPKRTGMLNREEDMKRDFRSLAIAVVALVLMARSEEHTSELQSHVNLVCRLLLEKKNSVTSLPLA